jgi:hypothetical protein
VGYVVLAVQVAVGVVFLAAVVGKLFTGTRGFADELRNLAVLPADLVRPAAVAVIVAEVAVLVLLVVPGTAPAGLTLAAVLLLAFAAALSVALARGRRAACRCFGAIGGPLGPRHVVRNVLLAGVAVVGQAAGTGAPLHPAGVAVAIGAGLFLAIACIELDSIWDLFAPRGPSPARVAGE